MNRSAVIKRVFLTGYMGSGKSFIGQALSKQLSWEFIDLDQKISNAESMSISDIFKVKGEEFFRGLEFQEVTEICKRSELTIVSLGGGAFAQQNINELLCQDKQSIVIYLKFSPSILVGRLEDEKHKRPLIATETDLEKFIEEHLLKRSVFYEKADFIIVDELDANQTVNQISTYLNYCNQKLSTI